MTLEEMAAEYRHSSHLCRDRLLEVRKRLRDCPTETEKMLLRQRCTMLESMARETNAVGCYLENYYKRSNENEHKS